jgi:hypothetical protein
LSWATLRWLDNVKLASGAMRPPKVTVSAFYRIDTVTLLLGAPSQ